MKVPLERYSRDETAVVDQLITQTPVLSVNPTDEGGPATQWGGFGMFCQNQGVTCR